MQIFILFDLSFPYFLFDPVFTTTTKTKRIILKYQNKFLAVLKLNNCLKLLFGIKATHKHCVAV